MVLLINMETFEIALVVLFQEQETNRIEKGMTTVVPSIQILYNQQIKTSINLLKQN